MLKNKKDIIAANLKTKITNKKTPCLVWGVFFIVKKPKLNKLILLISYCQWGILYLRWTNDCEG